MVNLFSISVPCEFLYYSALCEKAYFGGDKNGTLLDIVDTSYFAAPCLLIPFLCDSWVSLI